MKFWGQVLVWILWLFLVFYWLNPDIAHAEGKHKKKIHTPPNCAIINGQLRCWVIDPLPLEWPPEE